MTHPQTIAVSIGDDYPVRYFEPNQALHIATTLHQQGDLSRAGRAYQSILTAIPEHPQALRLLGVLCLQQGKLDQAERLFQQVLTLQPEAVEARINLAALYKQQQKLEEAISLLESVISTNPEQVQAWNNLAGLYQSQGQQESAVKAYSTALERQPDYHAARVNLAALYLEQGACGLAVNEAEIVLNTHPKHPHALKIKAVANATLGDLESAEEALLELVQLTPEDAEAHFHLGAVQEDLKQWRNALASHRRALSLRPDYGAALSDAIFIAKRLCQWDQTLSGEQQQFDRLLQSEADGLKPFVYLACDSTAEQQLTCARSWGRQRSASVTALQVRELTASDKITVGYVSNGFGQHPTGCLTAEYFEHHDQQRFRTIGYSIGRDDGSDLRHRISRAFDQFRDASDLSHESLARQIQNDKVDILVDMRGYGGGAVTEVFARKPAPIQVNWLAYPGTMGADFIDYIVLDPFLAKSEQLLAGIQETPVILPGVYQPNDTTRDFSAFKPSRELYGLPESGIVFCCFNNSYKFSEPVFSRWMDILKAVPGSVLWLLAVNTDTRANLQKFAERCGICPERLIWLDKQPHLPYLACYPVADLFLDTYPYSAHTTASDALWAGCPVLTMPGQTFASRVGASLVSSAGLGELVVDGLDQYMETAIALAEDQARLQSIKERLKNKQNLAMFQMAGFTANMERAFERMFEHTISGASARLIDLRFDR